jgi:hypothetical protein
MKYLHLLILMLFSLTSFGQIGKLKTPTTELVGKIAPGEAVSVTMECYKYEDSTYLFRYIDAKFSKLNEWKDFKVKSTKDFDILYFNLRKGFENMPKETVTLNFGGEFLFLDFSASLRGKVVRIAHSTSLKSDFAEVGFTKMYTNEQIDKLFGKR